MKIINNKYYFKSYLPEQTKIIKTHCIMYKGNVKINNYCIRRIDSKSLQIRSNSSYILVLNTITI